MFVILLTTEVGLTGVYFPQILACVGIHITSSPVVTNSSHTTQLAAICTHKTWIFCQIRHQVLGLLWEVVLPACVESSLQVSRMPTETPLH